MSGLLTRRTLVTAGVATAAGAAGLGAAVQLAGRYGIGKTLTYSAQRLLTSGQSLAREFPRSAISNVAPVNGPAPKDEAYRRLRTDDFKAWRLTVDGMVARASSFSLEQLKSLPPDSHINLHACEEG